jgi:hypothetical protein
MATFEEYCADQDIELGDPGDHPALGHIFATFSRRYSPQIEAARRDGLPINLSYYVVDAEGFNAFAGTFDDGDIIGVHRDVPTLLLTICRAVASHGSILPKMATPGVAAEAIQCPHLPEDLETLNHPWVVNALRDPEREKVAQWLFDMAMTYILAHEFAHLYSGHVGYLGQVQPFAVIVELESVSKSHTGYERETIEWDADLAAASQVLQLAVQPAVHTVDGVSVWVLPDETLAGTFYDAVVLGMAGPSICAMLLVSGEQDDWRDLTPRSHPHPMFRTLANVVMVQHTLEYRTGQPKDTYDALVGNAIKDVATAWKNVFPQRTRSASEPDGHESFIDVYRQRAQIWTDTWSAMYDDLNKFKLGGTLAPRRPQPHPAFSDVDSTGDKAVDQRG